MYATIMEQVQTKYGQWLKKYSAKPENSVTLEDISIRQYIEVTANILINAYEGVKNKKPISMYLGDLNHLYDMLSDVIGASNFKVHEPQGYVIFYDYVGAVFAAIAGMVKAQGDTSNAVALHKISLKLVKSPQVTEQLERLDFSQYVPGDTSCFICHAVYLEEKDFFKINNFRKFRDDVLAKNFIGLRLIKYYYSVGPKVANFVKGNKKVKYLTKKCIDTIHFFVFLIFKIK